MRKNAFTLIEFFVLMAILSLVTALFVPSLAIARRKALELQAKEKAKNTPALTVSNLPPVIPSSSNNVPAVTNLQVKTNTPEEAIAKAD